MPYVDNLFGDFAEVIKVNGRTFSGNQLKGADALLVRSVTEVNQKLLLNNHSIKFIGSATIGTDHIDADYLKRDGIFFVNAPGCNAKAVGEFAFIAMLELAERYQCALKDKTVGIMGAGNTGSAVSRCLEAYGVKTMLCDPLLKAQGDNRTFYSLNQLISECDVISLHLPITKTGLDPTWHLFGETRLSQLKKNSWLLNCGRGGVIDNHALINVKRKRDDLKLVLDVWEEEPSPNAELVALTEFATPHIAGYSLEGKARGSFMLYQAFCQHFNLKCQKRLIDLLPSNEFASNNVNHSPSQHELLNICRKVYDINNDDLAFRKCFQLDGGFDQMRKNHIHRREFSALPLVNGVGSELNWLFNLGFSGASL